MKCIVKSCKSDAPWNESYCILHRNTWKFLKEASSLTPPKKYIDYSWNTVQQKIEPIIDSIIQKNGIIFSKKAGQFLLRFLDIYFTPGILFKRYRTSLLYAYGREYVSITDLNRKELLELRRFIKFHKDFHFPAFEDLKNKITELLKETASLQNISSHEHYPQPQEPAEIPSMTASKEISKLDTYLEDSKEDLIDSAYRNTADEAAALVRDPLVAALAKSVSNNPKEQKKITEVLILVFSSPVGLGLIKYALGAGLTVADFNDERVKLLAKEMRTGGIAAVTKPIYTTLLGPIRNGIISLIQGLPSPKEATRIGVEQVEKTEEDETLEKAKKELRQT